ncbi:MAG: RpiB/LacA/LacB family sugar-phosphate isomerase [bacterium]|nr:RpiB/LacA/LacB family sugar-phosphate isomerase [bacterium]
MIYLGADHGGFELKNQIMQWLEEWSMPYEDLGAYEMDEQDDYPDFAFAVADKVAENPTNNRGILACRSAAGVIIAANKVKNIRAVATFNKVSAQHSREHNDANVIGLSGDWLSADDAKEMLQTWLTTDFSNEARHQRRLDQITKRE